MTDAALQTQFRCGRHYGAFLLMSKPTTTKVEDLDDVLLAGEYEHLKGKKVVAEIVTCPAYALYLTGRSTYQADS